MRIEIVDFGGGVGRQAGDQNPELDELPRDFAAAGRNLVRLQPARERFALTPDMGEHLHPGRTKDGRPVVIGTRRHFGAEDAPTVIAFFDEEGNYVESQQVPNPPCEFYEDLVRWLTKEHGYRPQTRWVHEFSTPEGFGIRMLWAPGDDAEDNHVWEALHTRDYLINWCNRGWAHGTTGEVHTT